MNQTADALPTQLIAFLTSITDPMLLFSNEGELIWVNQPFCRVVGRREGTLLHRNLSDVLEAGDSRVFEASLQQALKGQHAPVQIEVTSALSGDNLLMDFNFSHISQQDQTFLMVRADIDEQEHARFMQFDEETYKGLLNAVQSGVLILEKDQIQYTNEYFCELSGFSAEELLGRHFFDMIHPNDVQSFSEAYSKRGQGGIGDDEYEFRVRNQDGLVTYVYMVLGELNLKGRALQVASVHNVTMRKLAEEDKQNYFRQLQDQLEYVDNLIERLPLGAWIIDFLPCDKEDPNPLCNRLHKELGFAISIRRANEVLCQMLGYSQQEMVGKSILDPMFVDEANAKVFLDALIARRLGKRGSYEVSMRHQTGHNIPILLEAIPTTFHPETGEAVQSIGLMVDLTERKAWESELQRLNAKLLEYSKTDALTGLSNRRSFDEFLSKERARALREKWELSLVIIDIDFFKKYNDGYGHLKGDDCLRKVSAAFSKTVKREIDLLARYGGEEFAVVLPSTGIEGATILAEQLRKAVLDAEIPHEFSSVGPYVTISSGVATMHAGENISGDKLIVLADEALYQSKMDGRNRVTQALRTHSAANP